MMRGYSTCLLKRVRHHLRQGGIIAYPTESCYGFGCDPFNYRAITKIINLKGRSKTKGLIVIAGTLSQLHKLLRPLPATDYPKLNEYWPGFYSLLLPVTNKAPRNLIGQHTKIAVRVSQHPLVRQLCQTLHLPLVSTSANKSGCRTLKTQRECIQRFGQQVLVLPGLTSFAKKPSTIIDWPSRQILRTNPK